VRYYLAKAYTNNGQYPSAIELLEEHASIQHAMAAKQVTSQSIAADFLLGQAYFNIGNSVQAVSWFESSLSGMKEISPRHPLLPRHKIALARAYIFDGQKSEGIELLESLVSELDGRPREDPVLQWAQRELIEAYYTDGQIEMSRILQQHLYESPEMRHSGGQGRKLTVVDRIKGSQPS
jgi:tetratricopeptide (TPR) repeat protein